MGGEHAYFDVGMYRLIGTVVLRVITWLLRYR